MFNSRELEGEVDHSFFDSDCDSANLSKDAGHRMEKCLKGGKDNRVAQGKLKEKSQNTKGEASPRSDGATVQLAPDKSNSDNRAEENSSQSTDEERGRASSVSCDVSGSDTVTSDSSESDQDTNIYSRKPNGKIKSLLAEDEEVDSKTMFQQSPNNSDEDVSSSAKHPSSKGRNKQSPKRRIRNRRIRSPSPSSTEASVDADSESSCSSVTNRSSSGLPSLPRPNKSSLSPGVRGTQIGSAGPRNVLVDPTEKAEDTVTDVSPLSSSDFSPQQSLEPYLEEATEGALTQHQQQKEGSVPSSGLSPTQPDEDSDQDDDCSLSSESQFGGRTVFVHPGGRHRKNYSFTNDQVRRIDQENQRLLRELSRLSPGPRPASTAGKKTHTATNSLPIRLSHSALNRQREQQRIERENLAFLKRLESVKPSPGLKRSQQLADYQQQISYLRGPSYPVFLSTTKRERSTTKTPSAGPRPVSSVHRSPRPVSTSTDSRNTPRSKKPSAARPAWC